MTNHFGYDEDFYNEPSEFEMQIEEFKKALLNSVSEDYKLRMERLVEENKQLQQVKKDFEAIKRDFENKKRSLEIERDNLKREVRRERLSELTKDLQVIMYKAYPEHVQGPKCDKCDSQRKIHYKTPLGNDASEKCECAASTRVYKPKEFMRVEFNIRDGMRAWYEINNFESRDEYCRFDSSSIFAKAVYKDGMTYESIESYSTFFKSKDECQKYCDYLNSKEDK